MNVSGKELPDRAGVGGVVVNLVPQEVGLMSNLVTKEQRFHYFSWVFGLTSLSQMVLLLHVNLTMA